METIKITTDNKISIIDLDFKSYKAIQERIVRQEVNEMQRRKKKAAIYMEVEDGREMDHKHFGQEENALV